MHYAALVAALLMSISGSPAWAIFETNKELAESAKIPMDQAVKAAIAAVPGKAVEAQLGKEEGRTVYEVEIIDAAKKTHTVYVDAQTGKAIKTEK
jgi:uncharacterized membrane protein YkoI